MCFFLKEKIKWKENQLIKNTSNIGLEFTMEQKLC